ncbi:putative ADP-ribose pyrophosphatase YjhB [Adhaeribacter aerolatus]|uniref:Putative ADP-ribose pyrophosphatase YjhB n=1 Tax=Adhaeribacter aerolatus TaxID=670289 RepID=A0A512AX38_9BACT|nr:NUDIX hydrolase [Adhaeribacter aerolatus]GEO04288.1 putative ADP-ribose pyrophosphatase YjhB [Adhaeribacter aerolatus]
MPAHPWLEFAKRVQALAQAGLTYAENSYDQERYQELSEISVAILAELSGEEVPRIKDLFTNEIGYQTPKTDVRAVVFKDGKILMVREKIDNCWSLPGGWADVGFSPGEVAVKETREEAGLEVKPTKILAVLDKKCHPHPPSPYHTYKIFILCETIGGTLQEGSEILAAEYFDRTELPELSTERGTVSQVQLMFEFLDNPAKATVFD